MLALSGRRQWAEASGRLSVTGMFRGARSRDLTVNNLKLYGFTLDMRAEARARMAVGQSASLTRSPTSGPGIGATITGTSTATRSTTSRPTWRRVRSSGRDAWAYAR